MNYIIVNDLDPGMEGWTAPKGTSGVWGCNRWSKNKDKVKHYRTESAAKAAQIRNRLGGFVVPETDWK